MSALICGICGRQIGFYILCERFCSLFISCKIFVNQLNQYNRCSRISPQIGTNGAQISANTNKFTISLKSVVQQNVWFSPFHFHPFFFSPFLFFIFSSFHPFIFSFFSSSLISLILRLIIGYT